MGRVKNPFGPSEQQECLLVAYWHHCSICLAIVKLSRQLVLRCPRAILGRMELGENMSTASKLLLSFLCTPGEKQLIVWQKPKKYR